MVSPITVSTTAALSSAIFVTCLSYKGYSPENLRDFAHATPRPFPRGQAVEILTAPGVQDCRRGGHSLSGLLHLKHLDRVSADKFAVQILQREVADLIVQNKLLRQGSEAERRSQHCPVVAEIPEGNGLIAGNGVRHELTDPDRLAQNSVVAAVPEVIAIGILQRSESQSRLVVHKPYAVPAVLRPYGKVQADDVIVGKGSGSNTDPGSCDRRGGYRWVHGHRCR